MSGRLGMATSLAAYHLGTAVGTPLTLACEDCGRMMLPWMKPRCWGCDRKACSPVIVEDVTHTEGKAYAD